MQPSGTSSFAMSLASIAVNRFGYGAREGELAAAAKDPKAWVIGQLKPVRFDSSLPTSAQVLSDFKAFNQARKAKKTAEAKGEKSSANRMATDTTAPRHHYKAMTLDNLNRSVKSDQSVSWRLLDFFSNHFSVSGQGRAMVGLAPTLEREAIAPHMLSEFENLLLAVSRHPAMLVYLNNERSIGPNSRIGNRRKVGINENLAREILELHTLGVDGGYSQQDVTELAKGISGWSIKSKRDDGEGFIYRDTAHEPGSRMLLGKRYSDNGQRQGENMLLDLARHPSTANYLCRKIATHFIAEQPPAELVELMVSRWRQTNGHIGAVMRAMVQSDLAWQPAPQKLKTPREMLISSLRVMNQNKVNPRLTLASLKNLGQVPHQAGSPAGYSDSAKDWLGASALMTRIDWANTMGSVFRGQEPKAMMKQALGDSVSGMTYKTVARAESRQQAMTLLLMSPEFQRR
ncbi:DUF1800 domain-containing protein [Paraferrimonas sedimenticola]|uniref:DUF1800 domain-containing protein n=1 Tax=Paraferrimonas sedimenticola TaxID=375674 RepID=A0AA37RXM4_9GAMM|nr:DUF1800 domain-containing protein [Paraferrimonas sedimenticola]GLP97021.1 hypothetical protein GCM10007895_23270 [Paraferrimonas sedimenticola]